MEIKQYQYDVAGGPHLTSIGSPRNDEDVESRATATATTTRPQGESLPQQLDGRSIGNHSHLNDDDDDDDSSRSSCTSSSSLFSSVVTGEYEGGSSVALSDLGNSFNNSSSLDPHTMTRQLPLSNNTISAAIPRYADGEFDDEKVDMITKLMQKHAGIVTSSLVERSNLIQSVTWLSRHVPGCVFKSLLKSIVRSRKRWAKEERNQERQRRYDRRFSNGDNSESNRTVNENGDEKNSSESNEAVNSKRDRRSYLRRKSSDSCGYCVDMRHPEVAAERQRSNSLENPYGSHPLQYAENERSKTMSEFKSLYGNQSSGNLSSESQTCNSNNIPGLNPSPPMIKESTLPITRNHSSALLFADISGFTKISVMMDVEPLSNAINSYFQMIVDVITSFGGDVLKFAGDAVLAEWKVSRHRAHHDLECCVGLAADCAAAIVGSCSDYAVLSRPIGLTLGRRRSSLISKRDMGANIRAAMLDESILDDSGREGEGQVGNDDVEEHPRPVETNRGGRRRSTVTEVATLNVKCGIGAGHLVGVHVGDDISRREYLVLGDPIRQVAEAEGAAEQGEAHASPEAMRCLLRTGAVKDAGDFGGGAGGEDGRPVRIANRGENIFRPGRRRLSQSESVASCEATGLLQSCDELDTRELRWLKRMISLYVHPVVVNDENDRAVPMMRWGTDHDRHLAESELRNVYTCFVTPLVDYVLTGDDAKDRKLFHLLNDIMNLTTRELDRVQGHLRQYILDDKGLVLICTFGLRGSTFPNMITQRAVPFSLSIHKALEEELNVKSTVGATFGKVYCGVVGGLERHEFAVLGPSVNLAARLMASKDNPGILVDKNVRLLTSQIFFRPLPAVRAKGYDEPVPIFEPIRNAADNQWGPKRKNFVGRQNEIKHVMHVAKEMLTFHDTSRSSKLLFISAASGTGKSTLMVQSAEHVKAMTKKMKRRVIVSRNVSHDGDSRIPFSLFRSIFKDVLQHFKQEDEESQASMLSRNGSNSPDSVDFSISGQWDSLSLHTQSTKSSTMSTGATRFRFICSELNAPPEFVEVVGKRLLGLRERNENGSAVSAKRPNLQKIVEFMADAFVRCTRHANLVLLVLDDVQWMDDMSWRVVQAVFERGENVLILCGSRPPSSNPLSVDPEFWNDLQGRYREEGKYSELSLVPFGEPEVRVMIATTLEFDVSEIDHGFVRDVFTTSGGMPHYLSYVLDTIKRNKLTVRLENGMIGMNNYVGDDNKLGFGSVGELLLHRLDALDSSVRTVLHLSAVLGTEFDLLDAVAAYEEMFGVDESKRFETAMTLRESFDVAVDEGVIEQSYIFGEEDDCEEIMDEEDNLCHSLGNIMISLKGRRAHPFYAENRRLRFTHDSWKASILNVMLDERKQEIHEHVAMSLEKELDDDEAHHGGDFEKQIRVFKHWKSSGNFTKSAIFALDIGGQLMLLGLNSQAILLFDEVLDILKEMTDEGELDARYGGIGASVLETIDPPELEYLIKLNITKGKAYSTLRRGVDGAEAYQSALDTLNNTPCAAEEDFDRSVSFPIFSGLFAVLKMGAIEQDDKCSFEKDLCKKFVEQARLNGDPIHYGRALAMEAETLGRLGNFEQALEVVERIKFIYNINTHHAAICNAYASDRVAQSFCHSINFNNALGRTREALEICNYIVEEIVPKSDPKNIHNMFCLLYALIFTLKENGFALKARDLFQSRVVDSFKDHFGEGGSTYSKPMFRPILTMLDLEMRDDQDANEIDELTSWALDEDNFEKKLASCEIAWATFCASPMAVLGEVCFGLAKRQGETENRNILLQKAISLVEQSVANTASLPYANMYAKGKLDAMKNFQNACK